MACEVAYRDHVIPGLQDLQPSLVHQVGHLTVEQIKNTHVGAN